MVDEDRPVHVFRIEAICGRVELGLVGHQFHAERIKLGGQVAADPVGADHHQRANGILHRQGDAFRIAGRAGALGNLGFQLRLERRPVAVEDRDVLIRLGRPGIAFPARAGRVAGRVFRAVAQLPEESLPAFRDRARVARIGRLHLLDIDRVPAIQEQGVEHGRIHIAAGLAIYRASVICHRFCPCRGRAALLARPVLKRLEQGRRFVRRPWVGPNYIGLF